MKTCQVKDLEIGQGKPKICIPVCGINNQEILSQIQSFEQYHYDLIEIRIDFYQDISNDKAVLDLLKQLKEIIKKPILFTYRSLKEGGQIQLTDEQYLNLVTLVCQSQYIDLIDIELMSGNVLVYQLVDIAHKNNIKVIMSNHNFEVTPSYSDMIQSLEHMEILGADILKLAVMPQSYKDVISLLNLTIEISHQLTKPIVTIAMGELGVISRISGELTGSSITFASGNKASAPGQISVEKMNIVLEALHHD